MISHSLSTLCVFWLVASLCRAGSIIFGGDDLTDHGRYDTDTGELIEGWKYVSSAVKHLYDTSTLPGRDGKVILLGSQTIALEHFGRNTNGVGDAYEAYYRGLEAHGLQDQLVAIEGAEAIAEYLDRVGDGLENPSVIVIAGSEAANDFDDVEADVLDTRGDVFQDYARRGGSLLGHGSDTEADCYVWLRDAINIDYVNECDSRNATLTDVARTLFPSLLTTDVDINAGPCHVTFQPQDGEDGADAFSAFEPLVTDRTGEVYMMISLGTIIERTLVRMNCSAETTESGTFTVRLPQEEFSNEYLFALNFHVEAGTTGIQFEEILADVLNSYPDFTNPNVLDCVATLPGAFQASCPSFVDIRLLEICFEGVDNCERVADDFDLNGLGCPEPPCPICDGTPDETPVCDQFGRHFISECELNRVACLFPGETRFHAPCPTNPPTPLPTDIPTTAPPTPVETNVPTPSPTPVETAVPSPAPTVSAIDVAGEEGGIAGGVSSSGGVAGTALSVGGFVGVMIAVAVVLFVGVAFFWKRRDRVSSPSAFEFDDAQPV